MAIYALSIKHKSKGQGASARAHAQYIQREGRYAERRKEEPAQSHAEYLTREGKHERRRAELEKTWSGNMPQWASSPKEFWEAADTYERANGRVYTEVVIALPRELSVDGREQVVRDFIEREIGERFSYTVAIHNSRALDGGEQPHAHVMFSIRERDGIERPKELYFKRANTRKPELGGAKKSREWSLDERSNDRVNEIRATWEELANGALQREGRGERIDRRSLKAQGIDREPEPKMGPEVTQRLKRGEETEIGEKVLALRDYRRRQQEIAELEEELLKERAKVYDFVKEKERRAEASLGGFRCAGWRNEEPSEEERKRYRRTVDLVLSRYEREDGATEYRWKQSGKVAFVDKGDVILFNSITPTAVKAGLQVAKEKGWAGVEVWGCEEFRRENWLQGELMGVEIFGYEPKERDFELLKERRREEEQKIRGYQERERGKEKEEPQREKDKGAKVQEVEAQKLASELKRETIPALEREEGRAMKELRPLGYEGRPDDLMYMHGTLKRWPEALTDEELREKAFEQLNSSYGAQKDWIATVLKEEAEKEKQLAGLAEAGKKSFLKKLSLTHYWEKKKLSKELKSTKEMIGRAQGWLEEERHRLSTGEKGALFNETLDGLKAERANTEETRKKAEARHRGLSNEIAAAYRLKEKLERLGRAKVRVVYERGKVRPEDEREFNQQLKEAEDLGRKFGRGRS